MFSNALYTTEKPMIASMRYGLARTPPSTPASNVTLCPMVRSEEHTSELQSRFDLVCRLLLEKKKKAPNSRKVVSEEGSRGRRSEGRIIRMCRVWHRLGRRGSRRGTDDLRSRQDCRSGHSRLL